MGIGFAVLMRALRHFYEFSFRGIDFQRIFTYNRIMIY